MRKDKLTCIAVDDEPMALKLILGYIGKTPFLELKHSFSNAIEALEFFNTTPVDIMFLDIQMPDLSGMELSKIVKGKTKVIFTTAFDRYALEGFKVDALDYLLKPFNYGEFLNSAQKAYNWIQVADKSVFVKHTDLNKDFLFVKSGYKQIKLELRKILYFEGLKDYVKIVVKDRPSPVLSLMTLKSLERELPVDRFMRVNRSFIVALPYINEVERGLILINKTQITISDQYKDKLSKYIENNSL